MMTGLKKFWELSIQHFTWAPQDIPCLSYYKNIAYVLNLEPQKELKILNGKTNGYSDIKLNGSVAYKFKPFIAKYGNGYYKTDYQTKSLERALLQ